MAWNNPMPFELIVSLNGCSLLRIDKKKKTSFEYNPKKNPHISLYFNPSIHFLFVCIYHRIMPLCLLTMEKRGDITMCLSWSICCARTLASLIPPPTFQLNPRILVSFKGIFFPTCFLKNGGGGGNPPPLHYFTCVSIILCKSLYRRWHVFVFLLWSISPPFRFFFFLLSV